MIHSDEKVTVRERLLAAFTGTDLSVDTERRTDADYLIALGLAQQRAGRASGAAMRLQLTCADDYRKARDLVRDLAKKLNAKRGWRLTMAHAGHVGELALAHHVFPACPACDGRGREKPEGAPYLSGNICRPCHGTGKRPIQRRHQEQIRQVIEALEQLESLTEYHVRRFLR